MDKINKLINDIKSLKIQGATNVALAVCKGIELAIRKADFNKNNPYQKIKNIARKLAYTRPTEPLAQNAVRYIFADKNQGPQFLKLKSKQYQEMIAGAKEKIITNGQLLIKNNQTYLTHCHSSTICAIFASARKKGRKFSVFATETRPLYQGRITVKHLTDAGINSTLIVDDEAIKILSDKTNKVSAVFIGADLLSKNGFVNKVGSFGIVFAAGKLGIPVYLLTTLLKYDPRKFSDKLIEKRPKKEIWPNAPKGVNIYSPSFDFISYKFGVRILCEKGIIKGRIVEKNAVSLYSFIKNK